MSKPPAPSRVQLIKASTQSLEVSWTATPSAQYYVLQIQKFDVPPTSNTSYGTTTPATTPTTTPASSTPALPSPTPNAVHPSPTNNAATVTPATVTPVAVSTPVRPTAAAATPIRVQAANQKIIASPAAVGATAAATGTTLGTPNKQIVTNNPITPRTANLIRIQQPATVTTAATATSTAALAAAATTTTTTTTTVASSTAMTTTTSAQQAQSMSGMAALAAAAMTHKINMNNVPVIPVQATGTTTPIRMKNVTPGQQIRFAAPGATVLRAASPQQGKQIILQKPGQNISGQTQIVHLVKTNQGMMAVPKMSLIPGKTVTATGTKPGNQGPAILRLVNPNTVAGSKILTTMKTSNLVAMSKGQSIAGKQTIMITKPGGNGGLVGRPNQFIVVTTGSGLRTVQAVTTSQAASGQATSLATNPVNMLPLSAANHVTNQQGVKMIVVSSSAMAGGTAGKPLTITMPGQGGKTVTIATKAGASGTILHKNQLVAMPQLQKGSETVGKPVTLQVQGGGTKTVTLVPTSSSIVSSSGTVTDAIDTSKMLIVSPQKQPSATLATTSDGPATTDAALAALAAEAGLIDPVQESSSGLSFMMACDNSVMHGGDGQDTKSQESCNGNQDAATTAAATLAEPMQVDGEGNLIIPQVDGPGDLIFSEDESETAAGEEEPAIENAEPSAEPTAEQMEQDVDQGMAAITGDVDEPTTTEPPTMERSQSSESMNVEAILSGNDGTDAQEDETEPEKEMESSDKNELTEAVAEAPAEATSLEPNEESADIDQLIEEKEKEDKEEIETSEKESDNQNEETINQAENDVNDRHKMLVDSSPADTDKEDALPESSTEAVAEPSVDEQAAEKDLQESDLMGNESNEESVPEETKEPSQLSETLSDNIPEEKDESEPMNVEPEVTPMSITEPEPTPTPENLTEAKTEVDSDKPDMSDATPEIPPIKEEDLEEDEPMEENKEPIESTEPVKAAQSADPIPPAEPTHPAEPIQPAEPVKPVQPSQPAEPVQSAECSEPVAPAPARAMSHNGDTTHKNKSKIEKPVIKMEVEPKFQVPVTVPDQIKQEKLDDTTSDEAMALATLATAALGSTEPAQPAAQPVAQPLGQPAAQPAAQPTVKLKKKPPSAPVINVRMIFLFIRLLS